MSTTSNPRMLLLISAVSIFLLTIAAQEKTSIKCILTELSELAFEKKFLFNNNVQDYVSCL